MEVRCPHCHSAIELFDENPLSAITCQCCGSSFSLLGEQETATYETEGARTVGHFILTEQLGVGSFGSVWRAKDTKLDRTVAVKIPRKGQLDSSEAALFLREARTSAQLRHPNIVSVYEVGREGDTVFIVSEYVQGVTLAEWLTAKRSSAREAAALCAKVADALHHAHEAGVVHRDLKPGNIILDDRSEPHIMDFGLARRETGEVTVTVEGRILGTPAYMSPEQARGESHQADRRSDVYSLGVILFELLTGERPFRGSPRMLLHQIIHDDAPSPRKLTANIPRDLETICLKCLEKEPLRRYSTAAEAAEDIRRFLNQEPIQAKPITRIARAWRWCKKNAAVASLTVTLLIVLIAGTVISSSLAVVAYEGEQDALRAQRQATQEKERKRRQLYVSDMHLAGQALDANDLKAVERLLRRHIPKNGEEDLRGFEWYYLWRLWWRNNWSQNRDLAADVLPGYFLKIAVSRDGQLLAAVSPFGGSVTLWSIATGKKAAQFGTPNTVLQYDGGYFVAFSPISDILASPSRDCTTLVLRDVSNLNAVRESSLDLKDVPKNARFTAAVFSPRDSVLATSSDDSGDGDYGRVRIWNILTQSVILECEKYDDPSHCIAFAPDGRVVASGHEDGTVLLWDATSGKQINSVPGHTGTVYALAFSPDGKWMAAAGADRSVTVWEAKSLTLVRRLPTMNDEARSVAFSPDGALLAVGGREGSVRIWDTKDFVELEPIRGTSSTMVLSFLPDGRLAFATQNRELAICDVRQRAQDRFSAGKGVGQLQMACCDDHVVVAVPTNRSYANVVPGEPRSAFFEDVRLWRIETDGVSELPPVDQSFGPIDCIALSNRGVLAICEHEGARVALLDPLTGAQIESLAFPSLTRATEAGFSRDGERLAVGFADGRASVWRLANGTIVKQDPITTVTAHDGPVRCLAFNEDGTALATGGNDNSVIVSHVDSGRLLRRLGPVTSSVTSVAFSPSGERIAAGCFVYGGAEINVWDWPSGNELPGLFGHRLTVWSLAFLRDRKTLVSAGGDRVLKFWDLQTRQERFNLEGNTSIFHSLAVSPDEKLIVAGARDGTICLYHAATEKEVKAAGW